MAAIFFDIDGDSGAQHIHVRIGKRADVFEYTGLLWFAHAHTAHRHTTNSKLCVYCEWSNTRSHTLNAPRAIFVCQRDMSDGREGECVCARSTYVKCVVRVLCAVHVSMWTMKTTQQNNSAGFSICTVCATNTEPFHLLFFFQHKFAVTIGDLVVVPNSLRAKSPVYLATSVSLVYTAPLNRRQHCASAPCWALFSIFPLSIDFNCVVFAVFWSRCCAAHGNETVGNRLKIQLNRHTQ